MLLTPRRLFFFEKWYFDAQAEDGSFLFATASLLTLLGRRSVELVVRCFPASGPPLSRSVHLPGRAARPDDDRQGCSFDGGALEVRGDACHLRWEHRDAALDLRYERLDPPWTPSGDGILLRKGSGALLWRVPLPRGRVEGELRLGTTRVALQGLGYADLVQTDVPPWSLPLRELLWGRALGPAATVIWERPVFELGGRLVPVTRGHVREGERSRDLDEVTARVEAEASDPEGGAHPERMAIELSSGAERVGLSVHGTRLLARERIADLQELSGRAERWLYRTVTGDPVTWKLQSRVSGLEGAPLLAAHERVLWGRGRARVAGRG